MMMGAAPCGLAYLKCIDGSCTSMGSIDNGKADCSYGEDEGTCVNLFLQ